MQESELTKAIIGGAIEVHRWLGPGLLEGVYEEALCHELHLRNLPLQRQQRVPINYKNVRLASDLRLDLLVDGRIIVDVKRSKRWHPRISLNSSLTCAFVNYESVSSSIFMCWF